MLQKTSERIRAYKSTFSVVRRVERSERTPRSDTHLLLPRTEHSAIGRYLDMQPMENYSLGSLGIVELYPAHLRIISHDLSFAGLIACHST